MPKKISPVAASKGTKVHVHANARCSCPPDAQAANGGHYAGRINPTCPVHGHGRPAGTIV